jgi:hypothetical protein
MRISSEFEAPTSLPTPTQLSYTSLVLINYRFDSSGPPVSNSLPLSTQSLPLPTCQQPPLSTQPMPLPLDPHPPPTPGPWGGPRTSSSPLHASATTRVQCHGQAAGGGSMPARCGLPPCGDHRQTPISVRYRRRVGVPPAPMGVPTDRGAIAPICANLQVRFLLSPLSLSLPPS